MLRYITLVVILLYFFVRTKMECEPEGVDRVPFNIIMRFFLPIRNVVAVRNKVARICSVNIYFFPVQQSVDILL